MKNRILFLLLILTGSIYAQTLYPYKKGTKWGYANIDGKVIIKPKYDLVGERPFTKYTYVKQNNIFYFIDNKGKKANKKKYNKISYFDSGFKVNNLKCLTNELVKINCFYKCGFDGCCETFFYIYTKKGKIGIKSLSEMYPKDHPKYNKTHTKPIWDKFEENNNGLAKVKSNEKWGVINTKVRYLIPMHYEDIETPEYPSNINQIKAKYNGKWGLLNKQNEVLIPFHYYKTSFFTGNIAKVWINKNEYFFITINGVELIKKSN